MARGWSEVPEHHRLLNSAASAHNHGGYVHDSVHRSPMMPATGGGGGGFPRATSSPGVLASSDMVQLRHGAQVRGPSSSVGGIPHPQLQDISLQVDHGGSVEAADASSANAWARSYAAELSSRAQQGDVGAVEELASAVRFGLLGLPAQPEVARGLMTIAAQSGGKLEVIP